MGLLQEKDVTQRDSLVQKAGCVWPVRTLARSLRAVPACALEWQIIMSLPRIVQKGRGLSASSSPFGEVAGGTS